MRKSLLVMKAEIKKQQQNDYHSYFVYFSLLVWPILGFLEIYYTYRPFEVQGRELLAFLGTGFMAYTCFWSMVQNAWSMSNQERKNGTLEIAFLTPANRLAMVYGKALGALLQEVWMFCCFCIFVLFYTKSLRWDNLALLPLFLMLLLAASTVWGGMLNAVFLMDLFDAPMTLFAGTRIPVSCFPQWAKVISLFFPLTYCLNMIRFILGLQKQDNDVFVSLAGLIICLAVMLFITKYLLDKVEKHNRETGELQFY